MQQAPDGAHDPEGPHPLSAVAGRPLSCPNHEGKVGPSRPSEARTWGGGGEAGGGAEGPRGRGGFPGEGPGKGCRWGEGRGQRRAVSSRGLTSVLMRPARRWSFTVRPVRRPCAASVARGSTGSTARCCCATWWSSTRRPCSASSRRCAAGRRLAGTWAGGAATWGGVSSRAGAATLRRESREVSGGSHRPGQQWGPQGAGAVGSETAPSAACHSCPQPLP